MKSSISKLSKNIYTSHPFGKFSVDKSGLHGYLIDFLNKYTDKSDLILDVGCGKGYWANYFVKIGYSRKKIICYDQSASSVKNVKKDGFNAVQGFAEKIPLKNDISDISISIGVIHHAQSSEAAFAEIVRITKPKGKILVSVYNVWNPYFFFVYKLTWLLRYIYWNYSKSALVVTSILLYPFVQLSTLICTGKFLSAFDDVITLVADQVFTPKAELFSKKKLAYYAEKNNLKIIKMGLVRFWNMRYGVFEKKY